MGVVEDVKKQMNIAKKLFTKRAKVGSSLGAKCKLVVIKERDREMSSYVINTRDKGVFMYESK